MSVWFPVSLIKVNSFSSIVSTVHTWKLCQSSHLFLSMKANKYTSQNIEPFFWTIRSKEPLHWFIHKFIFLVWMGENKSILSCSLLWLSGHACLSAAHWNTNWCGLSYTVGAEQHLHGPENVEINKRRGRLQKNPGYTGGIIKNLPL